jgi:type II secretory pathway pseudopilin PulG
MMTLTRTVRRGSDRPAPAPRAAFTLIELPAVMGIIALLAGLLLPALGGAKDKARQTNSMNNTNQLMLAIKMYEHDYESYPPGNPGGSGNSIDELKSQLSAHLTDERVFVDDWGHPLFYFHHAQYPNISAELREVPGYPAGQRYNPTTFQLLSLGPDGTYNPIGTHSRNRDNLWIDTKNWRVVQRFAEVVNDPGL